MLVKLQLSPAQLRKLRGGKKIRIGHSIVGSGYNLIVEPSTYNKITRAVAREKGIDFQLSPRELEMNMEPTEELQGEGIFGKKFKKALKKIGIKKKVYKAADKVKPLAKAATKKAIGSVVAAAVTPVAGPAAGLVAGKVAGELASKQINKFYDHPEDFYGQFSMGRGFDGEHNGIPYTRIPRYDTRMGIVGGKLLYNAPGGGMHPALIPQLDSANYQFRFTTSKPYRMGGVGLYA